MEETVEHLSSIGRRTGGTARGGGERSLIGGRVVEQSRGARGAGFIVKENGIKTSGSGDFETG